LKKRCALAEDESKRTVKKRERADSAETETVVKKGKKRKVEVNHEAEWTELAEWRERMDTEWTELTEWRKQMDRKMADLIVEVTIGNQAMVAAITEVLKRVGGMEKKIEEMQKKVTELCEENDTPPATPREDGDEEMVE
jgi:seryl-tRNA synthetase